MDSGNAGFSTNADAALPGWMLSVPETNGSEIEDRLAWVAARYSDDIIAQIGKSGRLGSDVLVELRTFLVSAGCWYLDHKGVRHPYASFAGEREQLERIIRDTQAVLDDLSVLSATSNQMLWYLFHHGIPHLAFSGSDDSFLATIGLSIHREELPGDVTKIEHLRPHQIMESMRVLHFLAKIAVERLPAGRRGQQSDILLESWIKSALRFWHRFSPIAFDPRSPAFDFCYLALQSLEPDITEAEVRTAMRGVAEQVRKNKR